MTDDQKQHTNLSTIQSTPFLTKLHSFYLELDGPKGFKKLMSRKHPMSAYIVMDQQLNTSLSGLDGSSDNFSYSFLNKTSGPNFWAFGPGKFEKALKHYSYTPIDDKHAQLQLTGIIIPRSKGILNIGGNHPIYSFFKLLDRLTLKQFRIFEKMKIQAELFMMKHHAKVHEAMLECLFKNIKIKKND